jgi:predicted AlkP superfamily phosphohydrolase/phosphomutase
MGITSRQQLVLFALDSADPTLLRRWAGEGHLPALASIMQRGGWGELAGPELISEHGIWMSILTGRSRASHGYYHWRPLRPRSYDLYLSDLSEFDSRPFWARFPGRFSAAAVDVPELPLIEGMTGVQVVSWGTHNPRFPTAARPAGMLEELRSVAGREIEVEEKTPSTPSEDRSIRDRLLARLEQKGRLLDRILDEGEFDVVAIGFTEPHIAGHQFWSYRNGEAGGPEGLETALLDTYRAVDERIGRVLASLPREANVLVVSNVGIEEDFPTRELLEEFCVALGYRAPASTGSGGRGPLDLARRAVPAPLRRLLARRLSRESRERMLAHDFRAGTDWSATRVFSIPNFCTGFLRVNLKGREPQGIVEPGREYERLVDAVEGDLLALRDVETGKSVVREVIRTEARFSGERSDLLPDLFVEWRPVDQPRLRVEHPDTTLTPELGEFRRATCHRRRGFVAAAGPGLRQAGEIEAVDPLDIAPACGALLGAASPATVRGPLAGLLRKT